MWLFSHGRAKRNDFQKDSKSGISGQKWVELSNRFHELEDWGLIESKPSEDVANVVMFSLTLRGKELAQEIIELKNKFPELLNFESFRESKQI